MGVKLNQHDFKRADYQEFHHALADETALLLEWVRASYLSDQIVESGFELECFILDKTSLPADAGSELIESLRDAHVVSEIAKSNLELNFDHFELHGHALSLQRDHLSALIHRCQSQAGKQGKQLIYIGALPTANLFSFSGNHLTDEHRYLAIDALMQDARGQQPIHINMEADNDKLALTTDSSAIGGVIAAFQIHYRIGLQTSALSYNASQIIAAAMVAISSNSPFLMGHELWMESRIPFMEQFFHVNKSSAIQYDTRAVFGNAFVKESIAELFFENRRSFAILLPQLSHHDKSQLSHLKLHNGTIYRWNRPVIDFDYHGKPYFRIEARMLSSGPTILDMCANAAFYFGLMQYLTDSKLYPLADLKFETIKRNFYRAARYGLQANFIWRNDKEIRAQELILRYLIPYAREGLYQLDIDHADANSYLSVIEERVSKMKTGSDWQRQFYHQYGKDLSALTQCYQALQARGLPVHEWPI